MLSDFDAIRNRHIIFILVLASLILYAKSVSFTYTFTDDVRLVALNQGVLDDFRNFPRLFTTDAFMSVGSTQLFYRPLMNVLFMLESQIASGSTALHHGTNVLLHLACCILLFRVLMQLGTVRTLAGLAALLFCVHPLNTSAVVWIPGRNDTLLTLWILGSFSVLLQAVTTKKLLSLIGHFVLFLGALLTKESAVVFPVLTVSYLWLFHRGDVTRKLWLAGIAGYCLATMVWFGLRSLVPETSAVHMKTDFILVNAIRDLPAIL
ncbi:MAG TPA: hypothetical protein VFO86_09545, partial [Terriglobia bacterium]|nr:hypothetical protein [Terriglobia bacterium]